MVKTIIKFILIGFVFTLILGLITVPLADWRVFLLLTVTLGVLSFIPLVVAALTSKSGPKPTLYGTSAPKKYNTVKVNEGEKEKQVEGKRIPITDKTKWIDSDTNRALS